MTTPDHAGAKADKVLGRMISLSDETATLALGAAIAAQLRRGDVVTLCGDLGAGKTTLSRGILHALGHVGPVPSPTFTLVQHYETAQLHVAHFDLSRLASRDEIFELGFDDARHDGAVLVEWPEILGQDLTGNWLEIRFEDAGEGRSVCLSGHGDWVERLQAIGD